MAIKHTSMPIAIDTSATMPTVFRLILPNGFEVRRRDLSFGGSVTQNFPTTNLTLQKANTPHTLSQTAVKCFFQLLQPFEFNRAVAHKC